MYIKDKYELKLVFHMILKFSGSVWGLRNTNFPRARRANRRSKPNFL